MPLVLGVDSSFDATTVELRDADDGRVYGSGRAMHGGDAGGPGEQDPAVWWQALVEARHDAGGALGVAAVGAAAQQPGLVAVGGDGKLVRPALVGYAGAAVRDARRLEQVLGPAEWVAACGSVPSSALPIAKLAWMQRKEPDAFARIAWMLQPHDWLTLRLSRQVVTDRGGASGTGYWSPREERWRADLLQLVADDRDWEQCLPTVLAPHEPAGDREGVLIAAGTGERMAIALGLALEPGDVVVDTGGAVFAVRDRPTEDPSGVVAGYADATGRFLPSVETIDAVKASDHLATLLGLERSRFDQLVSSAPAGARGLVFVPPRADGRPGELRGIRGDTDAEDVARATLEGVVCMLLAAVDALRDVEVPVGGRLFLVGRGARMHAFAQVLADVGQRVVSAPKGERAASGACVQAAAALHATAPEEIARAWGLHDARTVEPDPRIDGGEIRAAHRDAVQSATL